MDMLLIAVFTILTVVIWFIELLPFIQATGKVCHQKWATGPSALVINPFLSLKCLLGSIICLPLIIPLALDITVTLGLVTMLGASQGGFKGTWMGLMASDGASIGILIMIRVFKKAMRGE